MNDTHTATQKQTNNGFRNNKKYPQNRIVLKRLCHGSPVHFI